MQSQGGRRWEGAGSDIKPTVPSGRAAFGSNVSALNIDTKIEELIWQQQCDTTRWNKVNRWKQDSSPNDFCSVSVRAPLSKVGFWREYAFLTSFHWPDERLDTIVMPLSREAESWSQEAFSTKPPSDASSEPGAPQKYSYQKWSWQSKTCYLHNQ